METDPDYESPSFHKSNSLIFPESLEAKSPTLIKGENQEFKNIEYPSGD